jgi:subtilisin-like proprotein convertase family protein
MVRSGGNNRTEGNNANDNAYASDPRVIAVAAVGSSGRAASYSNPGACLLVAAPGGEVNAGLFSTDLLGTRGANFLNYFPPNEHLNDYALDVLGFTGTSPAAALVSGVSALVLSANPELTTRDVQQILALSARHFDSADPDLIRNGAGLLVSHNVGFGVPDAGEAVRLAQLWPNRPAPTLLTVTNTTMAEIPDDGLRVEVVGEGVPPSLASLRTLPGTGPHADEPTASLPLVDVGLATNAIGADLTGKAALILRGTNNYADKITFAAQAGAAFAVVYNYATNTSGSGAPGGDQLVPMGGTDFTPIPAVFVSHRDGVALQGLCATNAAARARIRLTNTNLLFAVTDSLLCEHVGLRLQTDHPLRGDLRITLVSPAGTRSVLQRYNADTNAGPSDWTYYSTHHFFESSVGEWALFVSDEGLDATGSVHLASLMVTGVPITDTDTDGLDDAWEMAHFGSLGPGPRDDPDGDGYSNAREQVMGTDPLKPDREFALDLSRWNAALNRLSWPGVANRSYEVWGTSNLNQPMSLLTNVPGQCPDTEWFSPFTNATPAFFRVRSEP